MERKHYSDEDASEILREIDLHLHYGLDVTSSCHKTGISDKTYYHWRKKFGGMGRSQLCEMCVLRKENERLKQILNELQRLVLKALCSGKISLIKRNRQRHSGCKRRLYAKTGISN